MINFVGVRKAFGWAAMGAVFCLASTMQISASSVSDPFKPNLIQLHCANVSGEEAVQCLDDVIKAIKQVQSGIGKFKTIFENIRGPLSGAAEQFDDCQYVEVSGRHQTTKPAAVKAGTACAAEWNDFSEVTGELLKEACWRKSSHRVQETITRLTKAAEAAENEYDRCFAFQLENVHTEFSDLWGVSSGDAFFDKYKETVFDYKSLRLDAQLTAAFNGCKAALIEVAKVDPVRAESLKTFGRCQ